MNSSSPDRPSRGVVDSEESPASHFLRHAAVGLAAGLLGAFAMNVFARAVNSVRNGREADGAAPGDDRVGRGMQPPQAQGRADHDAAVRVGATAYRAITDREPTPQIRPWLGAAAHYAFSVATSVPYVFLGDRLPFIRACFGTLYGTAVWAVADEGIMPALGLSRGPRQLPLGVHAYALAGHLVYGATLEGVRRLSSGRLAGQTT